MKGCLLEDLMLPSLTTVSFACIDTEFRFTYFIYGDYFTHEELQTAVVDQWIR